MALTAQVTSFWLECDFDRVEIDALANGVTRRIWSGGCRRDGLFMLSTTTPVDAVVVAFSSDVSITHSGFVLEYEVVASSSTATVSRAVPCPGPAICSNSGACNDGVCTCLSGFVGEDCSNQVVCPRDVTTCGTRCDAACLEPPSNVLVVSTYGDDVQGTGELMDSSQAGTAPKAVKSLQRAIALATPGQIVLVYPGTYSGALNCDVVVTKKLTIRGLRGASVTTIDCGNVHRGLTITGASDVKLADLTLRNMVGDSGAAIKLVASTAELVNVRITSAKATDAGGAVYAATSALALQSSVITKCSAARAGGGLFGDAVTLRLTNSQVTDCRATDGGGVYVTGASEVTGIGSAAVIERNEAGGRGGGLFFGGSAIRASRLLVRANRASVGGGVALESAAVTIASLDVSTNTASSDGGGIAVLPGAALTSTQSTIRLNTATRNGGGVFVTTNDRLAFDAQSRILSNVAGTSSQTSLHEQRHGPYPNAPAVMHVREQPLAVDSTASGRVRASLDSWSRRRTRAQAVAASRSELARASFQTST